jgi:glycosyltransferase involved in cell wall biosynthesis
MPMDVFARHRGRVLEHAFRGSLRRTCVFEFPHPWAVDWVREFKSSGWVTIYDVIDDWEEFDRAGKALWYESAAERSMLTNCDAVTAVSASLAEKVVRTVPGLEVRLIPNGVSIESFDLARAAQPLRRGEVTVGYFGFLTPAWFDWGMVAETARRRPAWEFHIVGFGEPAPANLPRNVQLLGRVPHYLLDSYAKNWDVAIIPCKPNALSRHTDPIKVYEYLALGLPVVATNIPHLRGYPGVRVAESADEFERLLARAAAEELDLPAVASFLEPCAWANRARALLQAGRGGRSNQRD